MFDRRFSRNSVILLTSAMLSTTPVFVEEAAAQADNISTKKAGKKKPNRHKKINKKARYKKISNRKRVYRTKPAVMTDNSAAPKSTILTTGLTTDGEMPLTPVSVTEPPEEAPNSAAPQEPEAPKETDAPKTSDTPVSEAPVEADSTKDSEPPMAADAGATEPPKETKDKKTKKRSSKKKHHADQTALTPPANADHDSPMSHMPNLGNGMKESDFDNIITEVFTKKPQGKPDSIQAALVSAYETNPEIRAARADLRAADEQIVQAKAGWRPTITGTLGSNLVRSDSSGDTIQRSLQNGPLSSSTDIRKNRYQNAKIEAKQNLFQGGATIYNERLAKASIKAARAKLAVAEQTVFIKGTQTYLELLTKYVELELLQRNEDSLKKTLDVTKAKFEVGEETRTGVAQAEGQYAQAVALRITAEAELEGFKALFERIMNRKPGSLTKPVIPNLIPPTLDAVLERARLNNPNVIAAQHEELAARHDVDRTQTGLFPQLDLTGSSSALLDRNKTKYAGTGAAPNLRNTWLNDRRVDHTVGVQLQVPIYEQGLVRSKTRQAAEAASQKQVTVETVRREVMESAIRSWNDYKKAAESIEYYRVQVQARAAALEGVRQEYAVGSKILLDVLNEMARLVQSQLELVRNQKIYYYAAYQILLYMGDLNAKTLKLNVDLYSPEAHFIEVKDKF